MESHTLEILQQGVWASLTGGWFYDLRQNVFCNTFHLYLWLFLLCFPFILHLYFTPDIIIYSFYCGTIGVLFTILKLVNHKLHNMFDTSECIQEVAPGENLPISQKKKLQNFGNKTILEDEGIELKVLNGNKANEVGFICSVNEPFDDDSIISLEDGARGVSSTIDLKVDVHRINSSESSEESSLKPVREGNTNLEKQANELLESQKKAPDLINSSIRCKHNQLTRLHPEEGIQNDNFALSQSDCHIAKFRKESMEELLEEYKMSQSDCHISNLRQGVEEKGNVNIRSELSPRIPKHFNAKDPTKRKRRRGFYKNLYSDLHPDKTLTVNEKNKSIDMGNLASNGSCGVLGNQSCKKEQIKNTGSLELPLKDSENTSNLEKGLLYWKQQNLEGTKTQKSRQSRRSNEKLKIFSESNINSSDLSNYNHLNRRLTKASNSIGSGNNLEQHNEYPFLSFCQDDSQKEKSFLQILEENFDWYSSEYQNENTENPRSSNDHQSSKNSEGKRERSGADGEKHKSGLNFQIDSDDDSSDNCGSRSPLLCRHESLEKDSISLEEVEDRQENKRIPRTHSNEEKTSHGIGKIGRTLSVDENVVLLKKEKIKNVGKGSKNSASSFILSVCDKENKKVTDKESEGNEGESCNSEEFSMKFGKTIVKRESFLHRNKKLSLGMGSSLAVDEKDHKTSDKEKRGSEDVFTWANERIGLDWLFENTDSETENIRTCFWKYTYSEDSDNTSVENQHECSCSAMKSELSHSKPAPSSKDVKSLQGAIPKTRARHSEGGHKKSSHYRKSDTKLSLYPEDEQINISEVMRGKQPEFKKKPKPERENGIIDEEDADIVHEMKETVSRLERTRKSGSNRETYDSSSSSANELSSLLPLSSLLSSLHPPTSPLLAAFFAARKEIIRGNQTSEAGPLEFKENGDQNLSFNRNRQKRNKRSSRTQRASRSARVSSLPLAALASVVTNNSGTHIATSHDDTSQGAVHCFQDERGNWMSYTFDSHNNSQTHLPFPLPLHNNLFQTNFLHGGSASVGRVNNTESTSKFLQPISRTPLVQPYCGRDRDLSFSTFVNIRAEDESTPRPSERRDQSLGQGPLSAQSNKSRKPAETWDSNINLVSNSNSENESSLSLNSSAVSPNVDISARPTFASFVRERFLANQRSSGITTTNNSYSTNPGSNSSSCVLSLNEFHSNDNNNNSSNSNNNNNNITSPNNNEGMNRGSHFYAEGMGGNSMAVRSPFGVLTESFLERNRTAFHSPTIIQDCQLTAVSQHANDQENERNHFRLFDFDDLEPNGEVKDKPRHYYKLYFTPWNFLKIRFDRLELMALLDRNLSIFEIFLSLLLSIAVSVCGIILLNLGFYRDLFAFLFCFSLAGCQYSLLKSVQPDATSPTHGYNRVVVYSRSIYFCVTSLLILFLSSNLDKKTNNSIQFYCIQFSNSNLIKLLRDGLLNLLLFFPVLFTLGIFPQINTFCLYLLEQIDMHFFGGNAMSSLLGSVYCVLRSFVTSVFVYGFAYGALTETKGSQHILFSIFSGLLISLSYHLSRSSSNPNIVWNILKNNLLQEELEIKSYPKDCAKQKKINKTESDKSIDESMKSDGNKEEGDEKSEDRNSQNNLLLNSNPSSNEMLKAVDSQLKSTSSDLGSGSELEGERKEKEKEEFVDPLPGKLKKTVNGRLRNDAIVCSFAGVLVFAIHCSTVFTALQPDLNPFLWGIAGCSGVFLHYIIPELRKHLPWLCLSKPVLKCHEHGQFEVKDAARVMWFEKMYVILCFLERNVLYPVLVLAALTYDSPKICEKLGVPLGAFVTSVCGLKVMRSAFSNTSQQYLIVIFSALFFEFDYSSYSETFLVDYFFMGIIFAKTYEFLLKIQFVVIYIAPWQITWGSAFHAFAQPFSVPHSAMLFIQAAISALLSAPLNPFLGSAIFLASYVRPIKFWERDYNTKRVDHSNTRLSSHLERNLGSDDNNLNSIFYEHLTRSLQHSLCGDLEMGRWGPVFQGDCFVLASDYLNCLVHIIEMGNGLVTFQMRGLEFRGTYCQQREVEAISERVEEDDGCCCCEPGHIPHILSVNAAFSKRWLAWEVTATKYVLEGYSISDNSAASTLQSFDFRKVLVTYYVKSIIFYCISSPKLQSWLTNPTITSALDPLSDKSFVDLDPVFNVNIDQDFDIRAEGITRNSFCNVYLEWIQYCCSKREKPIDKSLDSTVITLCLALSLMGRRSLGTASHNTVSSVEFFLYGLHALFKGDFRITSIRDDWVFADMEFLMKVVAPGVRMSLKLHQDHFMSPEEYQDPGALYDAISSHEENLVISHEGDPAWRSAVLSGTPSLLALRHVLDDGTDEYKIIMLNKRFLSFRVIKLNRECVRGLWAGQQQELVFLRNRNPERGSIQNAKQVLRNMINSSCDQPIGYPIYVSPLTTSYSDTNNQYTRIVGGPLSFQGMKNSALKLWKRIRQRCREGCSSGSARNVDESGYNFGHEGIYAMTNINVHSGHGHNTSGSQSMDSSQMQLGSSNRGGSLGRSSLGGRGSLPSVGKPSSTTLASLAGLLSSAELSKGECFHRERETSFIFVKERQNREEKDLNKKSEEKEKRKEEKESKREKDKCLNLGAGDHFDDSNEKEIICQRVRIVDPNLVFDALNLGRRIDVLWPDEGMRLKGGRSYWKDWLPDTGMEGQVVHRWVPNHRDPSKRSIVDKTILLIKIEDKYVPIAEAGVQDLGVEV